MHAYIYSNITCTRLHACCISHSFALSGATEHARGDKGARKGSCITPVAPPGATSQQDFSPGRFASVRMDAVRIHPYPSTSCLCVPSFISLLEARARAHRRVTRQARVQFGAVESMEQLPGRQGRTYVTETPAPVLHIAVLYWSFCVYASLSVPL